MALVTIFKVCLWLCAPEMISLLRSLVGTYLCFDEIYVCFTSTPLDNQILWCTSRKTFLFWLKCVLRRRWIKAYVGPKIFHLPRSVWKWNKIKYLLWSCKTNERGLYAGRQCLRTFLWPLPYFIHSSLSFFSAKNKKWKRRTLIMIQRNKSWM